MTEHKQPNSPSKSMSQSENVKSRKKVINPSSDGSNISYRNQKEIMRKIFGNE